MSDRAADVLVLGAGVIGLTTAVCLAEGGLAVTIRTAELPQQTTSAVAGAIWGPHLVEDSDRVRRWGTETLDVLAELAGRPETGVRLVSGAEAARSPAGPGGTAAGGAAAGGIPAPGPATPGPATPGPATPGPATPAWMAPLAALGPVTPAPPGGLPPGFAAGWRYTAPVVCMPVYLDYLLGRFRQAGGEVRVALVRSLDQAVSEATAPVVVNCTGAGARRLVPDPSLAPVRGQVVITENPGIAEFFIGTPGGGHEISYLFPHADRVVLGGTEIGGDWSADPRPGTAARILRDCAAIDPRLERAGILEHRAGLRPVRPLVRLEATPATPAAPGRRLVVHNYGHGGGGVTLSWGCAREAALLARAAL